MSTAKARIAPTAIPAIVPIEIRFNPGSVGVLVSDDGVLVVFAVMSGNGTTRLFNSAAVDKDQAGLLSRMAISEAFQRI